MKTDDLAAPRAVIFDWDNTLVDTWPVIHDSMNATLIAMDKPPWTIEQTRERVRRALREDFPDRFGDRWEEARDIFYQRFRDIHLERLAVLPGAEELLETIKGQGTYLGVVSNKMGDHLRREADHLGWNHFFGKMIGAMDAPKDKPAPETVLMALAGSGIEPGPHVWFVGDTGIDLECGQNAGCSKILIREASPQDGEFEGFPPDLYFSSCIELQNLVRRL
jgi:phosphoglycolate phosphatase